MATTQDKNWASQYILGPLNEPTPGEETGPAGSSQAGSRSQRGKANNDGRRSRSTNPFRRSSPQTYKAPPGDTVSQRASSQGSRSSAHSRQVSSGLPLSFPEYSDSTSKRKSAGPPARQSSQSPASAHGHPGSPSASGRPRRSSSLRERYPGDNSHRPLETITQETKRANRSPHLRKKHIHGPDSIDALDVTALGPYHHESPYDAASLARNNSFESGPLAAVDESNREALRATPRENVEDAVLRHRPLDGVAVVPPGMPDRLGRVYQYKEGTDLMIEEGGYKRWPGLEYVPEDLKGKGEPSYTIEKELRQHGKSVKKHSRNSSGTDNAASADFELVERPRNGQGGSAAAASSGAQHMPRGDLNARIPRKPVS